MREGLEVHRQKKNKNRRSLSLSRPFFVSALCFSVLIQIPGPSEPHLIRGEWTFSILSVRVQESSSILILVGVCCIEKGPRALRI
jgi:hypothetical protein